MELNIKDYLGEDELKEIVHNEVRNLVSSYLREDGGVERVISNSAYHVIWDAVDEVFDREAHDVLKEKVVEQIRKLKGFNIFNKPDAWGRESNSAYQVLERIVLSKKDMMENKVNSVIGELDEQYLKDLFEENFTEIILGKLQSKGNK